MKLPSPIDETFTRKIMKIKENRKFVIFTSTLKILLLVTIMTLITTYPNTETLTIILIFTCNSLVNCPSTCMGLLELLKVGKVKKNTCNQLKV